MLKKIAAYKLMILKTASNQNSYCNYILVSSGSKYDLSLIRKHFSGNGNSHYCKFKLSKEAADVDVINEILRSTGGNDKPIVNQVSYPEPATPPQQTPVINFNIPATPPARETVPVPVQNRSNFSGLPDQKSSTVPSQSETNFEDPLQKANAYPDPLILFKKQPAQAPVMPRGPLPQAV
jgi:hypothetical protein